MKLSIATVVLLCAVVATAQNQPGANQQQQPQGQNGSGGGGLLGGLTNQLGQLGQQMPRNQPGMQGQQAMPAVPGQQAMPAVPGQQTMPGMLGDQQQQGSNGLLGGLLGGLGRLGSMGRGQQNPMQAMQQGQSPFGNNQFDPTGLMNGRYPQVPQMMNQLRGMGTNGMQGMQGMPGLQGLQGLQGMQGLQGLQGLQGMQGMNSNGLGGLLQLPQNILQTVLQSLRLLPQQGQMNRMNSFGQGMQRNPLDLLNQQGVELPDLNGLQQSITDPLSRGRMPDTNRLTQELGRTVSNLSRSLSRGNQTPISAN